MPKLHHHHLAQEQQGFTSLVISLTLVLVLALLVVGFGQLTRREQQDALNKQLSTQAYYAAETGINDAVADINASPAPTLPKTNCSPNGTDDANGWHKTQANQIDKTLGVSYSCLLVNLNTPNMVYNTVNPDDDKTALFQTNDVNDNPVNLSDLTIHWGSTDGHTSYPTTATADADKFLPTGDWNSAAKHYPGVIRLAITPLGDAANTNAATPLTRAQLASNTFTVFLYPTSSPSTSTSTVTYLAGNAGGNVVYADCTSATAEYNCTATISGLGATNSNRFLIHFLDLYDTSNISIDGDSTDSATPPVTQQAYFSGAQAMIDSTGKARDVLKRLQVRIPLRESTEQSNYTIEAQNICKRFDVYLDNYNNDNSAGAAKTACNLTGVTWPVGPVDPGPTPPVAPSSTEQCAYLQRGAACFASYQHPVSTPVSPAFDPTTAAARNCDTQGTGNGLVVDNTDPSGTNIINGDVYEPNHYVYALCDGDDGTGSNVVRYTYQYQQDGFTPSSLDFDSSGVPNSNHPNEFQIYARSDDTGVSTGNPDDNAKLHVRLTDLNQAIDSDPTANHNPQDWSGYVTNTNAYNEISIPISGFPIQDGDSIEIEAWLSNDVPGNPKYNVYLSYFEIAAIGDTGLGGGGLCSVYQSPAHAVLYPSSTNLFCPPG
jgi:Tfp pilus assembly protein PilX